MKNTTRLGGILLSAFLLICLSGITAFSASAAGEEEIGRMMLVLDSSGSMKEKTGGSTRIAAAKQALTTVVDGLPESQDVGLRVYGAKVFSRGDKGACTDSQRVVDAGTDNRAELRSAIAKYKPYGETPTGYALQQAGKDLGKEGQRTIVLVSDGEPTCAPDPCKVAAKLSKDGIEVRIDVVGLDVSGKARDTLKCVADEGNGTYYDADSADELTAALATVAERSATPYEAIGKPVVGGPDASSATSITTGDWRDTLGGVGTTTGQRWYKVSRKIAGSHLRFTATLANQDKDALHVKAFAGAEDCGLGVDSAPATYRPFLTAPVVVPGFSDFKEECAKDDEITFSVTRGIPDAKADPKERDAELEIRVIEEPPVTNEDSLPERAEEAEQPKPDMTNPQPVVGGNSFGNAVAIKPGAYSGTLVPGEAQLFEIDARWGQVVNAAVDYPPPNAALADALTSTGPASSLWIYSPARASASSAFHVSNQTVIAASAGSELHSHTYPITFRHRTSFVDAEEAGSIAGKYYISVAVAKGSSGGSYEIPFTLGVDVLGDVAGEPKYKGGDPVIGTTDKKKDQATSAKGSSDSDGLPLLPIGLGVVGVIALGAAALVFRKSRAQA